MSSDVIMMKGISLMHIMSTASVRLLCLSRIPSGNSLHVLNIDGFFLVILRFSDPKLGPRMSSALRIRLPFYQNPNLMSRFDPKIRCHITYTSHCLEALCQWQIAAAVVHQDQH